MKLAYVLPTIFATVFMIIGVKLITDSVYIKGASFALLGSVMMALLLWKSRLFRR